MSLTLLLSCDDDNNAEPKIEAKPAVAEIQFEIDNSDAESLDPQEVTFYLRIERLSKEDFTFTEAFDTTFTVDVKHAPLKTLVVKKIAIADVNKETLNFCGGIQWTDHKGFSSCAYWNDTAKQNVCRLYTKW
ncbi:hypothetical protein DQQ10_13250 [Pseudochryseolinea flava]|uniref:PLAT domain-containing protein n=2 Tax=Pseudochryseolinea flava TaxID=2059302 RepID=A0A364Y1Q0_9BACT|nr:hypothetical protein DQQ10_13250 [Pseudochryseolinea flava]